MHNDRLDTLYIDPLTKCAIGALGLGVVVLGLLHGVGRYLAWQARPQRPR